MKRFKSLGLFLFIFLLSFEVYAQRILRITPINQYACNYRVKDWFPPYYKDYAKRHFYYPTNETMPFLPQEIRSPYCHDIQRYGQIDSPRFPRLEEKTSLYLWDNNCHLCGDRDLNGEMDLNQAVTRDFRAATGNSNAILTLFYPFDWSNMPTDGQTEDTSRVPQGVIMIPFVTSQNRGTCPKQDDYFGNNSLYKVLGPYIGLDTQGLFLAESEPQLNADGEVILDHLLITEKDLKRVWFYFENGQHFAADETTSHTKLIHFYHPFDFSEPLVRKSGQIIYTIRFPDEVGINMGVPVGVRPPDKRFACIPLL